MRRFSALLLLPLLACGSSQQLVSTLSPAEAAEEVKAPTQVRLDFQFEAVIEAGKDPVQAGATLLVPAPRGEGNSIRKLLDVSSGYERGENSGAPSAATEATWMEDGLAATRVACQAWTRQDERLAVSYAVQLVEKQGEKTVLSPEGKPVGSSPISKGPSLEGSVVLPAAGGKVVLGEIRDPKGRWFRTTLQATAEAVAE